MPLGLPGRDGDKKRRAEGGEKRNVSEREDMGEEAIRSIRDAIAMHATSKHCTLKLHAGG